MGGSRHASKFKVISISLGPLTIPIRERQSLLFVLYLLNKNPISITASSRPYPKEAKRKKRRKKEVEGLDKDQKQARVDD
jgi:hypothetical protein